MFRPSFNSTLGPIGIDLGTSGMKFLQLRSQGGNPRIHAVGELNAPLDDSMPTADLASAVKKCLSTNGFSGRKCVVSLPRCDVRVQSVRMPQLPDAELKQTVRWEASERFHLDRESIEVDYLRMGEVSRGGEARDEVLIIAADRNLIHRRLEPLVATGLRPMTIDYPVAAMIRWHSMRCRREADRTHVRAFLEIGRSGSTFVVTRGDQIMLCKPIDTGGRDFDDAVASHLGIAVDVARELRQRRLRQAVERANDSQDRAAYEAVRALMDRVIQEVGLCMRYYGVTFRGTPPERIIVSGGDGMEPHFDEMIRSAGHSVVSADDPVSSVDDLMKAIAFAAHSTRPAQCWSVAAGLGLRGLPVKLREDAAERAARRAAA